MTFLVGRPEEWKSGGSVGNRWWATGDVVNNGEPSSVSNERKWAEMGEMGLRCRRDGRRCENNLPDWRGQFRLRRTTSMMLAPLHPLPHNVTTRN